MKLHASGRDLIIKESERLISGSVNLYSCEFTFDSEWDGYTVTAVFSTGSRLVNMAVVDGKCDIPVEVLRPNAKVRIGVFGTDGIHSKPTTYSEWITVEQGADVSGNTAQPPTPSVYEQWMGALDEKHEEWNANEQARIEAEEDRVEAEQKREDLETGYVAQAKAAAENAEQAKQTAEEAAENAVANVENKLADHVAAAEAAQKAAEKARDEAGEIAGGDFASKAEAQGYANTAEANANEYTDQKIAAIPTPDVSGQIGAHNADKTAHADIREAVSNAETNANAYTDRKISEIPTPDVSGQISAHNTSTSAHSDIRQLIQQSAGYTKAQTLADVTKTKFGLGADAVPDDVLNAIKSLIDGANANANAKAQIATGSYTGTGTYGASNPNSLTFDFVPKVVFISAYYSDRQHFFFAVNKNSHAQYIESYKTGSVDGGISAITSFTNTLSWYSEQHAMGQMNASGGVSIHCNRLKGGESHENH